jgi:hypothetical protein
MIDDESTEDLLGGPILEAKEVLALNIILPIEELPLLLRAIRLGRLPARTFGDIPALRFSWIDGDLPKADDFRSNLSPQIYKNTDMKLATSWPHAELLFRSTSLSDWCKPNHADRYNWLRSIDGRFRIAAFGSVAQLATRLGLKEPENIQSLDDARCWIKIVAPFRARISRIRHRRDTDEVQVFVDLSKRIPPERVCVVLAEHNSTRPPRSPFPLRETNNVITIRGVLPGKIEISLFDNVLDSISIKNGSIQPKLSSFPRVVALEFIDPRGSNLLENLSSTDSDCHEQGAANLLQLLGYAPLRWDRKKSPPKNISNGRLAIDLIAFHSTDKIGLIVECTTDWLGDGNARSLWGFLASPTAAYCGRKTAGKRTKGTAIVSSKTQDRDFGRRGYIRTREASLCRCHRR